MRFYAALGWWVGVGIAVDNIGVTVWFPFVSLGVDWKVSAR